MWQPTHILYTAQRRLTDMSTMSTANKNPQHITILKKKKNACYTALKEMCRTAKLERRHS